MRTKLIAMMAFLLICGGFLLMALPESGKESFDCDKYKGTLFSSYTQRPCTYMDYTIPTNPWGPPYDGVFRYGVCKVTVCNSYPTSGCPQGYVVWCDGDDVLDPYVDVCDTYYYSPCPGFPNPSCRCEDVR